MSSNSSSNYGDHPEWLSAHVYYHEAPRRLLASGVRGLVDELQVGGLIAGFFFLNHWQGGRHVRLRFAPAPGASAEVRALVGGRLADHLRRDPSREPMSSGAYAGMARALLAVEPGHREVEPLVGDNTIRFTEYAGACDPVTGSPLPAGLRRAVEDAYVRSSRRALDLVDQDRRARHTHALATLVRTALSRRDPAAFVAHGYRAWGVPALGRRRYDVEQRLDAEYATRPLTPAALGRLADRYGLRQGWPAGTPDGLVDHCVHVHCNRLGLSLADEAALRYLLLRAWQRHAEEVG